MADAPFNTASVPPIQLLGLDGAWPIGTTNPLPVSIGTGNNPLGKINYNATTAQLSSVVISTTVGAGTTATLLSGTASQVISVYRMLMTNSTANSLTFRNGTTALTGAMPIGTNGSITLDFSGEPWFVTGAGAALNISASDTTALGGRLYYLQA